MNQGSALRVILHVIWSDKEFFTGFVIGIVLLIGEIGAPEFWKLTFRSIALVGLVGGLMLHLRNEVRASRLLRAEKQVPIVLVAGVPRRRALEDLEMAKRAITKATGFDEFERVQDSFNVQYEHLLIHREELPPPEMDAWQSFLYRARDETEQFLRSLQGSHTYHVFSDGRITSLSFGLGAIISTRSRVIAYNYEDDRYRPVLDLSHDIRRVKLPVDPSAFRYISVSYPETFEEDTAVVLNLASHHATADVRKYLREQGKPDAVVEVNNLYDGNLTEDDWTRVVQEVYQCLAEIRRGGPHVGRIHLFHATPAPLALGLGVALGPFINVVIYHWYPEQATYFPVLELNQLREGL